MKACKSVNDIYDMLRQLLPEAGWAGLLAVLCLQKGLKGKEVSLERRHGAGLTITICPPSPESTTQAPCGFGSSLVTQLLTHWKYEGYIRWLRGLAHSPHGSVLVLI